MPAECSVLTMVLNSLTTPVALIALVGSEESRWSCSPSSCDRPRSTRWRSSMKACTGISSTEVTPRRLRWSITGAGRQPGVGAAQVLRNVGMVHGEAAHMQFVDHHVAPGDAAATGRRPR